MAVPNMIVTLVANTTKYAAGLRRASKDTTSFSRLAANGFKMGATALVGLGVALARVVPNLAQMGAESRKADIQLKFMLENMQGISSATDKTIKRMAAYADRVAKATGIDDESIKAVQKKILVFKSLRQTADVLGGTFDRTTQAALDLAAAGFGDAEANAIKLGRVLENPIKNMNALARAGIVFTTEEQKKIKALVQSGDLLKAQDLVLKSIENRVGGLAEKSATPFEKMVQQFNEMGDTIGEAMLPHLEAMNDEIAKWLSTPQGKEDLQDIVDAFVNTAKAINTVVGALIDLKKMWDDSAKAAQRYNDTVMQGGNTVSGIGGRRFFGSGTGTYSPGGGIPTVADRQPAGITVNFNTPVDSVSAGREIARVLSDYDRARGR